jgi:hypothetical protein
LNRYQRNSKEDQMRFHIPAVLLLGTLTVSACASSPSAIAPVSMGNAFASMSCQQAQASLGQERQTLAALESKQRGAVIGDAVGVFLIAVPVSSLTGGDKEGEIAASKGKVMAYEARLATCP